MAIEVRRFLALGSACTTFTLLIDVAAEPNFVEVDGGVAIGDIMEEAMYLVRPSGTGAGL